MALDLNPFAGLVETKAYPHARAYRTTFWQKIKDTFFIFFGYYTNKEPNNHAGVFDYIPLLGIIPLLAKALEYSQKRYGDESKMVERLGITISVLQVVFLIPRLLFALAMTLACFIPVGFIDGFMANLKGFELKNEVKSLQLPVSGNADMVDVLSLGEILNQQNLDLDDLSDIEIKNLAHPTLLELHLYAANEYPAIEAPKQRRVCSFTLNKNNEIKFFAAMKELNLGGIQSKQEAEEKLGYWV